MKRLLSSPYLRIPALLGVLVATVATSQPIWSLDDATTPSPVHVEPGKTFEAKLSFEASASPSLRTTLDKLVSRSGKLKIEHADSRDDCSDTTRIVSEDSVWRRAADAGPEGGTASAGGAGAFEKIEIGASFCGSSATSGTVKLAITNEDDAAIDFEWSTRAIISGAGEDEAPGGSFVRIEVVP